jgi:hypothetical protein
MIGIKQIFKRHQGFDDAIASIWFGAAVPFTMALAVTLAYLISWFDIESLDWLFVSIGGAIFAIVMAGGWIFPLIGIVLGTRGLKANKNVAAAAIFLSASELVFYVVVMGSLYLNSNTLVD